MGCLNNGLARSHTACSWFKLCKNSADIKTSEMKSLPHFLSLRRSFRFLPVASLFGRLHRRRSVRIAKLKIRPVTGPTGDLIILKSYISLCLCCFISILGFSFCFLSVFFRSGDLTRFENSLFVSEIRQSEWGY